MVRRINIDGDDQADRLAHGGEHRAVFVYQIESYRYWERELGRDDFTYGQFGENFTVEGLADDEVCIGDRYRDRRGAVRGHPAARDVLPRRASGWTSRRCRRCSSPTTAPASTCACSRRGRCRPATRSSRSPTGPERLTVAEVDALLYLPGKSRALLERALRDPGAERGLEGQLPRAAREGAERRAGGARVARLPAAARRGGPARERDHHLVPARPADGGREPGASAGQYLTVRVQPDADAPPLLRSYSLSDLPTSAATGSASSARARRAATCTST